MALFEVKGLSVSYGSAQQDGAAVRLTNISFSLERGNIYDLTGPSGAGKSMLLRACAQMMETLSGSLLLNGVDSATFSFQEWRRRVGLVPQHATLIPGSIRDNLLLPWTLRVNRDAVPPADVELEALIETAALDVALDRDATKLSGGQAARVALVRTFATKPDVLLLDEVDAALDDASADAIGVLTAKAVAAGATCLRIRHRAPDGRARQIFQLEKGQLEIKAAACSLDGRCE